MTKILEAVRFCPLRDLRDMEIESDSSAVVNIIRKVWQIP